MKVYKFRCGHCGYESHPFEDKAECEQMKDIHETHCGRFLSWEGKRKSPKPPPTEIIYV